jgi:putative nucleotidyltransferase with HDIG domain
LFGALWRRTKSAYDERFEREIDETVKSGLRFAVLAGVPLWASFFFLDVLQTDGNPLTFLVVRLVAMMAIIVFGALGVRTRSTRVRYLFTSLCFIAPGASVGTMCLMLGGHASSYFAGIILVMMMVTFIPWRGIFTFATCAVIVLAWAAQILLFDPVPFALWDWSPFVNSLIFLGGTPIVAGLVSATAFALRQRVFRARSEQERANEELRILNEHLARQSEELQEAREELQANLVSLQAAYDHKSRFLDMISHELRTPLTCILTPLEGLLQGNVRGRLREVLRDMHHAAQQLHEQIAGLLDLSRYEGAERPLAPSPVDLGRLVSDHICSWRPVAQQKRIALHYALPADPVVGLVDRVEAAKVVRNLLANAVKFTLPDGHIRVSVEVVGGEVAIQVADTGIGIPPERLDDIFQPFVQVEHGDTRSADGIGIGLSLVRSIVARHQGHVEVESELGRGATFRVFLPACDAKALDLSFAEEGDDGFPPRPILLAESAAPGEDLSVHPDVLSEPMPPFRGWVNGKNGLYRLLLVEDNEHLLGLLRRLFADHFEIVTARDGREGLEAARANTPDVIVSDVMMPRMSGIELIEALRADEELKAVPVLLLTARASLPDRVRALGLGADDYLAKPFHQSELRARVMRLLQRRRIERTLTKLNQEMTERSDVLESRVRSMYLGMVRTLVAAVDAKDYYTGGHSERVAFFSVAIAQRLGLEEAEVRTIEMAALLHDIGKIGVPDQILNKPGTLTGGEIQRIRQHAFLSGQILAKAPELDELRQAVEQHHERWDGSGYPLGLAGEDTCQAARIVGIADTWDALLSDRIYRRGMPPEAAIEIVRSLSGCTFDPRIAQILVSHYREILPPDSLRQVRPDSASGPVSGRPQVGAVPSADGAMRATTAQVGTNGGEREKRNGSA